MRLLALLFSVLVIGLMPVQAQDPQQALDQVLSQFADADSPAVVVQVNTPQGSWTATGGTADGERPTARNDRFRIGSMSKTFVAVTALLLVDEGVFNLDDAASRWLPDDIIANVANAGTVTIRQLLGMRSGIPDYLETDEFWEAVDDDPAFVWTPEEALSFAFDLPAMFAPGEDYYYSNSNYLLAELVLENATGQPLHTLMRDRILDPLGLDDTYTQISELLLGGFVDGYEDFDGDGVSEMVSDINDGAGLADGGLISTADDLSIFYLALLRDQTLLSEAGMTEMLSFRDDGEGDVYGSGYSLGLTSWTTPFSTGWGHSGAVLGFVSTGYYLPALQISVIVLSADADFDPDELAFAAVGAVAR
ncbi:MAG: beta-lactamase family protein [Pleurocapsa minor GSE-CHR-MK-17-07R]|jgi:D-alanyl-D-alanine carboxypeptidase|nr:beta-lactamase family protein [Pleurocapsa minor GSE-CHR-MK 17-07R]